MNYLLPFPVWFTARRGRVMDRNNCIFVQGYSPDDMAKLSTVSVGELHAALERVSTGKATKRLMIALAYKDGVAVDTLSDRYGIPRSTVYYWLDRFEELSIDEAIEDDDRPGRPPALTADEREQLQAELAQSPDAFGFDAESWSTELIRAHIEESYGVAYSYGHVRRLRRAFEIDSV